MLRESAQAQIRVLVRRILRKYGYPPDKQEKATQTVLTGRNCSVRSGQLELSLLPFVSFCKTSRPKRNKKSTATAWAAVPGLSNIFYYRV
jgi:hypothetical protein